MTGTLDPRAPLAGAMPVTVGGTFAVTENENVVERPCAIKFTVAEPMAAVELAVKVAVTVVSLVDVMLLNVKPDHVVESDEPHRLLPEIVTLTLEFRATPE